MSTIDLTGLPSGTRELLALDDRPIVLSKAQNQTIDTAICSLRQQLAAQDAVRIVPGVDQCQALLQRLARLRSPVTRLPPEILVYIFGLYVYSSKMVAPVHAPSHGPFRLVQVCRLWRAVAESDACLWTSIQFYFIDSSPDREEDVSLVQPAFDLHLKRSGALPISLTFADHRAYEPASENLVSLLVDRLKTHAHRWKRISIHMSCNYFPHLFTFTPCDLSSLEHLRISGDVLPQRFALRLDLESATNLKSFAYSGPGHSVDERIKIHWKDLQEVSFEFASHGGQSSTLSRQFGNLAQCENITTLSVGIDRPFWRIPNGGHAITLPCLQTLRVRRLSPYSHAQAAIGPLVLPQLETLEIDAAGLVHWNLRWHDRTFSALLERSACPLRCLSIQDVDFPNEELVRCLRFSPSLTSLRFIPCPRSQDICDVIRKLDVTRWGNTRAPPMDGPLVPQLREITLASQNAEYLSLMVKMLRSRAGTQARVAGVVALRRAEVIFFDMWHDTDEKEMSIPGARFHRIAGVQAGLTRLVSENNDGNEREEEDKLDASVIIDSPYFPEYINE